MSNKSFGEEHKQLKGKIRYRYVDLDACEDGVAQVREWAIANKYPDPEGWRKVPVEELIESAFRHIKKVKKYGIHALDPESGLPHISHAQTNLHFAEQVRTEQIDKESFKGEF